MKHLAVLFSLLFATKGLAESSIRPKVDASTWRRYQREASRLRRQGKLSQKGWEDDSDKHSITDPGRPFVSGPGAKEWDKHAATWFTWRNAGQVDRFYGFLVAPVDQPECSNPGVSCKTGIGFHRFNGNKDFPVYTIEKRFGGVMGGSGQLMPKPEWMPEAHDRPYLKTRLGEALYFGQVRDRRPSGFGYLIHPAGNWAYIGTWKDGYFEGFGAVIERSRLMRKQNRAAKIVGEG